MDKPSKVENVILSALDPNSTTVYYLANGGLILLIAMLIILYFLLQSYHFIIMGFLALGLLLSVNYVWMNREDTSEAEKANKGKDTKKSSVTSSARKRKKKRTE